MNRTGMQREIAPLEVRTIGKASSSMKHEARGGNMEKLAYTVPEVAQLLGIGLVKAYELVNRQGFPALRIGRRIIIPVKALEKWLEDEAQSAAL